MPMPLSRTDNTTRAHRASRFDLDSPTARGVFDRVVDEICHRLPQPCAVGSQSKDPGQRRSSANLRLVFGDMLVKTRHFVDQLG